MKAYLNWSGGKDSALALYQSRQVGALEPAALFTSINAAHDRVSMHGVRRQLVVQQALAIGLPLYTAELPEMPGMTDYERIMGQRVGDLQQLGFSTAVFGDIFLEDLRSYREQQLAALGVACHFPLWKMDSRELMRTFIKLGFKAIVVCANGSLLDAAFCGRMIDESFLSDLPPNVDPCGENGEYHSFVFDGPIFQQPVAFTKGEQVYRTYAAPKKQQDQCFRDEPQRTAGFYFQDLLPA